jgi:hypothetical protein
MFNVQNHIILRLIEMILPQKVKIMPQIVMILTEAENSHQFIVSISCVCETIMTPSGLPSYFFFGLVRSTTIGVAMQMDE